MRDYGAKGDGAADNIGAINAALKAADAQGKAVYFPAGMYKISADIYLWDYDNLTIAGARVGKTIITVDKKTMTTYTLTG